MYLNLDFLRALWWRTECWPNYLKDNHLTLFLSLNSIRGMLWGQVIAVPEHNHIKFLKHLVSFLTLGWLNLVLKIPGGKQGWNSIRVLWKTPHIVLIAYYPSSLYSVPVLCGESPSRDSGNRLAMAPPSLILLPWECHSSHQGEVWLLAYAICLQTPVSWKSPPKGLWKPPVNSNHYVLLSSNKHRKSI